MAAAVTVVAVAVAAHPQVRLALLQRGHEPSHLRGRAAASPTEGGRSGETPPGGGSPRRQSAANGVEGKRQVSAGQRPRPTRAFGAADRFVSPVRRDSERRRPSEKSGFQHFHRNFSDLELCDDLETSHGIPRNAEIRETPGEDAGKVNKSETRRLLELRQAGDTPGGAPREGRSRSTSEGEPPRRRRRASGARQFIGRGSVADEAVTAPRPG